MNKIVVLIFLLSHAICEAVASEAGPPPQRIVSLAPSMTESLFALGLGDRIAGVTSFCDYPDEARKKPKIGGMSNPSLEEIVSLKPDLVVMTTDGNPKEVEIRLRSLGIRTYVWKARTIAELPQGIRELGAALGVPQKAEVLADSLERSIKAVRERSSEFRVQSSTKLKALFIVWPEPLIVAGPGTAIDDAMSLLGMENIASQSRATYPRYSIEEVISRAPDILFIGKASGMDMREVSREILRKLAGVPAVGNGTVFYVGDGLYRLGPRIPQGIAELAESLKN